MSLSWNRPHFNYARANREFVSAALSLRARSCQQRKSNDEKIALDSHLLRFTVSETM